MTKQIISQYHQHNNHENTQTDIFSKKQCNHHSYCNPEQYKSTHSCHSEPSLYSVLSIVYAAPPRVIPLLHRELHFQLLHRTLLSYFRL